MFYTIFWILQSIWYQTLNISYTERAVETIALRHCLWTGYKTIFDMTNPCITIFTGYFWDTNSCFGGHSHRMQGVYNIRHPFIASAGSIEKQHFLLIQDKKKCGAHVIFVRWLNMPWISMRLRPPDVSFESLSSLPVLQRLPMLSWCNNWFFPVVHKKSRLTILSKYIIKIQHVSQLEWISKQKKYR